VGDALAARAVPETVSHDLSLPRRRARVLRDRLHDQHRRGKNTKARLATRQAFGFRTADAVRAMIDLRCTGLVIPLPHHS
jgi:hypothetical protein